MLYQYLALKMIYTSMFLSFSITIINNDGGRGLQPDKTDDKQI